jgi:hypothetical protein
MKKMIATAVSSSIIVASLNLSTLMEVRTIKHKPSKFEEVFNMCGDFSLRLYIGINI